MTKLTRTSVLQQAVVALYFDEKGDEVLCEDLSYVGERTIVECVDPVAGGANPCPPRYTLVVINNSPRCVYTG